MRKRNALALNAAVVGAASFFQCYASRISAYLRGNLREILFFYITNGIKILLQHFMIQY